MPEDVKPILGDLLSMVLLYMIFVKKTDERDSQSARHNTSTKAVALPESNSIWSSTQVGGEC